MREQNRFYGRADALDLGAFDLELIEEFFELIFSHFSLQFLKPELSDLRQIFVGLFLIQQLIPLGAPTLIPRFAVVSILKTLRLLFRPPLARLDILKERGFSSGDSAGAQSGQNKYDESKRVIYD